MKLLLTSAGISNPSIKTALVELLGKPIEECNALHIPTALHAINNGANLSADVITGKLGDPFCQLGWKSLSILELTALPSLRKEIWISSLDQADVLLVGGGDCQYLSYWMLQSGLAGLLPQLLERIVYIGLSAGSIVMGSYGTTYGNHALPTETRKSLDLFDFAIHPHLDHEWFPDNSMDSISCLASTLPMPSYAIDDQSAIIINGEEIIVVSEGNWKLFEPAQR